MGRLKAVFLDADGVLNKAIMIDDKPAAPTSVKDLVFFDDVKPSLQRLREAGYLLICVTNKPDVERGLMTQEVVDEILDRYRSELKLDDVCVCFHEKDPCFKPKPGMILEAASKHNIDLTQSFMVGDRCKDIECGQAAKVKTIWINWNYPLEGRPDPSADFTADSMEDAANWILGE
jgi:D-glycero-D-manno-heptose 1,7-bisphosphate phosphatase